MPPLPPRRCTFVHSFIHQVLFAAGNDGDVSTVGSPAQCKNCLTVGASETVSYDENAGNLYEMAISALIVLRFGPFFVRSFFLHGMEMIITHNSHARALIKPFGTFLEPIGAMAAVPGDAPRHVLRLLLLKQRSRGGRPSQARARRAGQRRRVGRVRWLLWRLLVWRCGYVGHLHGDAGRSGYGRLPLFSPLR